CDVVDDTARRNLGEGGIDLQMRNSAGNRAGTIGQHCVVVARVDDLDISQGEGGVGPSVEICQRVPPLITNRWAGARGGNLEVRAGPQAHRLIGWLVGDDRLSVGFSKSSGQ